MGIGKGRAVLTEVVAVAHRVVGAAGAAGVAVVALWLFGTLNSGASSLLAWTEACCWPGTGVRQRVVSRSSSWTPQRVAVAAVVDLVTFPRQLRMLAMKLMMWRF